MFAGFLVKKTFNVVFIPLVSDSWQVLHVDVSQVLFSLVVRQELADFDFMSFDVQWLLTQSSNALVSGFLVIE